MLTESRWSPRPPDNKEEEKLRVRVASATKEADLSEFYRVDDHNEKFWLTRWY